ncbi:SDR family oxidoreductase [Pseudomonas sp. J452]|uniref:SDR family oxidoreductase n=1 Tax=Pseudomonas sp. J452 TaxID=2898441 RepID=UPI0021AD9398|nr:SDR family oxidoreductase [Pseudomonas sp. J452]UUY08425.1 SDR family oxidoreductase [Pseudomonas sp. J452]
MSAQRETVLITGAARGIGAAIAERFIEDGYDVILNFRRAQGKGAASVDKLVAHAEARGVRAYKAQADISETRDIEQMVKNLQAEGVERIDHLVLNAASAPFKSIRELTKHDWKELFGTSLIGNVACINHVVPLMPAGGTICAISGVGSHAVLPNYPLGLMKAALENLVRYMEVDLYDKGIRVNGVCGGVVKSEMLPYLSEMWPGMIGRLESVGRRWALEPMEIANIVAFLASDRSTAIRGHIVMATGGTGLAA